MRPSPPRVLERPTVTMRASKSTCRQCSIRNWADLLVLETFGDLNELREAIFAAREAAGPDPVIVAQVAVDDFGRLSGGASVETFAREMNS